MEVNRNIELLLCNLAFQEYNLRQNILQLLIKEKTTTDAVEKHNIQLEIEELREKANSLFSLREEQENEKSL